MKFIHAADLHLDSPFQGLANSGMPAQLLNRVRQSTFDAATKIFDTAIEERVDFVLLVGDLFDRSEQSINAKYFLNQQLKRLEEVNIPVLISFGNHDYYAGNPDQLGFPANVFVFSNSVDTTTLTLSDGTVVSIAGFSFANQWVSERMITQYPDANSAADWNIGMLHGSAEGVNSNEGTYAPFSIGELKSKHYDYWALGHIHQRQSLDDQQTINYPGNTQGRHINEAGKKGFLMVSTQGDKMVSQFIPSAVIDWTRISVTFSEQATTEMIDTVFEQLSQQGFERLTFVRIEAAGEQMNAEQRDAIISGRLLELIQKENVALTDRYHFWVTSIKLVDSGISNIGSETDQQYFESAKDDVFTTANFQQLLANFDQTSFVREQLADDDGQADVESFAIQVLTPHFKKGNRESDN